MSGLEQDTPRRWRRFSEEFKRETVRLVMEEGCTFKAAAATVGVNDRSLFAWHAKFAPAPLPCSEHASVRHDSFANLEGARLSVFK